jgi:hypothetical protein
MYNYSLDAKPMKTNTMQINGFTEKKNKAFIMIDKTM